MHKPRQIPRQMPRTMLVLPREILLLLALESLGALLSSALLSRVWVLPESWSMMPCLRVLTWNLGAWSLSMSSLLTASSLVFSHP